MNHLQSSPAIKNPHDRIRNNTPKKFNKEIDKKSDYMIKTTIENGSFAIRERLSQLDKEWDIDRALMFVLSTSAFYQLGSALKKSKKGPGWFPFFQSAFLLMHTTFGWSPPVLLLRKLGFRTRYEIQAEREELLNALINNESEIPGKKYSITEWDIYGSI